MGLKKDKRNLERVEFLIIGVEYMEVVNEFAKDRKFIKKKY